MYPLEDHMSGDERWTDVTFRLGLIGRLIGENDRGRVAARRAFVDAHCSAR